MKTFKFNRDSTRSVINLHKKLLAQPPLNEMLKDPNEPLDKWIIRKSMEQVYGGMDEQGMNRKADAQNPNPSFLPAE